MITDRTSVVIRMPTSLKIRNETDTRFSFDSVSQFVCLSKTVADGHLTGERSKYDQMMISFCLRQKDWRGHVSNLSKVRSTVFSELVSCDLFSFSILQAIAGNQSSTLSRWLQKLSFTLSRGKNLGRVKSVCSYFYTNCQWSNEKREATLQFEGLCRPFFFRIHVSAIACKKNSNWKQNSPTQNLKISSIQVMQNLFSFQIHWLWRYINWRKRFFYTLLSKKNTKNGEGIVESV